MNNQIQVNDIISGYNGHLILRYLGGNSGVILFISQEFADKEYLPSSFQEGSLWVIGDLSKYSECNAWKKWHKLDGLYGKKI